MFLNVGNPEDRGMSILKIFFSQNLMGCKILRKHLTNRINLTKFAIFPMNISVSKAG